MKNNMKRFICTAVFVVFSIISNQSNAESKTPTEASLNEMMEIMDIDKIIQKMTEPQNKLLESYATQLFENTNLTETKRKQAQAILAKYLSMLAKEMDTPENQQLIKDGFLQIHRAHYTQKEVDAMINFYGSDVGQGIIKKQSVVSEAFRDSVAYDLQKKQIIHLKSLLPKMLEELKLLQ